MCTQEAEEEREVALEQLGQQQMAETKGLKEEFEKDREELDAKLALVERNYDELSLRCDLAIDIGSPGDPEAARASARVRVFAARN